MCDIVLYFDFFVVMKKFWLLMLLLISCTFLFTGCGNPVSNWIKDIDYEQIKQVTNSWAMYLWEKTSEFIENNEDAQKVLKATNEALEQAKQQANELAWKAKEEAIKQYKILKEETKNSIKQSVNDEVDKMFEKF